MIEISNLSKSFKDKEVLKDLSLTINDGSIMGLVGINGAGKSTLLRLITGIYEPNSGSITIDGKPVFDNEDVKKDIFFLPDEPFYGINTTPKSLVKLYEAFYKIDVKNYERYLTNLNISLDGTLKKFSKGMKRQVFIALALCIRPKYLFLDEAFDGLDPLARLSFKKYLVELVSENNTTVIISSHSLRELEDICDTYAVLDNKKIETNGNIDDDIHKYHKYQVAFKEELKEINVDAKSIKIDKRIAKIITTLEYDEFEKAISSLNPIIIDEISIDFEELFIIEVENRGYLND